MQSLGRRSDTHMPNRQEGGGFRFSDRWGQSATAVGVVLLSLPVLSVIGFLFGIPLGDTDPFARGDLEEFLVTIDEHSRLYALSLSAFVVQDLIVLPTIATMMYLTFRKRSRLLAVLSAFGLVIGAACSAIHDAGALTLGFLADDFVEAEGTAGDPATLEVARSVSVLQGSAALMAMTAVAVGVTALGLAVGWSTSGDPSEGVPPRWLAYAGLFGGACYFAMWSFFVNHAVGGTFTLLGELGTMVMVTGLGIWFLRQPRSGERS